jgi:membrane-bound lytic murein transglycosylase A
MKKLIIFLLLLLSACGSKSDSPQLSQNRIQLDRVTLQQIRFSDLQGWQQADLEKSYQTFKKSCQTTKTQGINAFFIQQQNKIRQLCNKGASNGRRFFEENFIPYEASDSATNQALYTGYYLPLFNGSFYPTNRHQIPIYPKVNANNLPPRSQIVQGAMERYTKPIFFVDNQIDEFFLQVQGSGFAKLDNGQFVKLAFAGKNGHPYVSIGKKLIENGEMQSGQVNMFSLKDYIKRNPQRQNEILNYNPSYVFFKVEPVNGELTANGAIGVPLTPFKSIAVDKNIYPYGLPVWIETVLPNNARFNDLMVAQDTGGAITGPLRADIFMGFGPNAEYLSGHMQNNGKFIVLLPR